MSDPDSAYAAWETERHAERLETKLHGAGCINEQMGMEVDRQRERAERAEAERDALRAWAEKASLSLRERDHNFECAEPSGNLRCVYCKRWHAMWSGEGCPAVDPIPFDEWFAALSAPSPETPKVRAD